MNPGDGYGFHPPGERKMLSQDLIFDISDQSDPFSSTSFIIKGQLPGLKTIKLKSQRMKVSSI